MSLRTRRGLEIALLVLAGTVTNAPALASSRPLRYAELPASGALPPTPPVGAVGGEAAENEGRLRVGSAERVTVRLRQDGTPVSVRARQRLAVQGVGDFLFVVPAPARAVLPAPGSQSRPGLRPGEIVWQGFSPGRKILGAVATLFPEAVRDTLPVDVDMAPLVVRRAVSAGRRSTRRLTLRITITNQTAATAQAFTARRVVALDAARALDRLKSAVRLEQPLPERPVRVAGTHARPVQLSAALRIRGSITFAGGVFAVRVSAPTATAHVRHSTIRFRGILGGAEPLTMRLIIHADATRVRAPGLRLVVKPLPDARLRPPAASWAKAVVERRTALDGHALLTRAITLGLRYGRARQFTTFLANPDPFGPSRATYIFRSASDETTTAGPPRRVEHSTLLTVMEIIGCSLIVVCALVVLWAHA